MCLLRASIVVYMCEICCMVDRQRNEKSHLYNFDFRLKIVGLDWLFSGIYFELFLVVA